MGNTILITQATELTMPRKKNTAAVTETAASTTVPANTQSLDVAALLKAASQPVAKGGRKATPELSGLGALADKVNEARVAVKNAEASFAVLEGELLEKVGEAYQKGAVSGDFSKSYNVPGDKSGGVQVTYTDRFSPYPIEALETMQVQLGDRFSRYFEVSRDIEVSDTSDETVQLLAEKLGPELFVKLFKVTQKVVAKPDMDRHQFELPELTRPKQYKPSTKAR